VFLSACVSIVGLFIGATIPAAQPARPGQPSLEEPAGGTQLHRADGDGWDLATDFSFTDNPNGQWQYGWVQWTQPPFDPNNFTLYDVAYTAEIGRGWHSSMFGPELAVWKNTSTSTQYGVGPGQVSLHPYQNGQGSVVRWVAPATGWTYVSGRFYAGDSAAENYHILQNGIEVWGYSYSYSTAEFGLERYVNTGDRLDFVVEGNYGYGNTPLDAYISLCAEPEITAQPLSRTVLPGRTATFRVELADPNQVSYRWMKGDGGLDDVPGKITGAQTAELTILNVDAADAGFYAVEIDSECGSTISDSVELRLVASLAGDLNCDGAVNYADVEPYRLALVDPNAYALAYPDCDPQHADMDHNGVTDVQDVVLFLELLGISDCNHNWMIDSLEILDGTAQDCNHNGVPDECDIADGLSLDADANDVPDECQADTDGDGVIDTLDGCPTDAAKTAPGACGCGVTDTDTDGDGVPDCIDNCPSVANPDQTDANGDGIGDACATQESNDPALIRALIGAIAGGEPLSGRVDPNDPAALSEAETQQLLSSVAACPLASTLLLGMTLAGLMYTRARR